VLRVPGGRPVAILFGAVGFLTTAIAIVLATVPAANEPDKTLAVVKIVGLSVALIGIGAVVYAVGRRRAL
jgi:energy-converting hydrogenase Eha subunit E